MDFLNKVDGKIHLLIGVTGSIASIKIPLLIENLTKSQISFSVALVYTKYSKHFFNPNELDQQWVKVYSDQDEWDTWTTLSDPVLHIELRKWADIMLIAPLDANTLSKIAYGICDNLLTSVVRAWNLKKPLLFSPAMNTLMWEHPVTIDALAKLKTWGYIQIPVVTKKLACGEEGPGGMAEVSTIIDYLLRYSSSILKSHS